MAAESNRDVTGVMLHTDNEQIHGAGFAQLRELVGVVPFSVLQTLNACK
jgi:hypothetical protein